MSVYRLENRIQSYAWGSTTVLPDLLGYPADGTPAAELWMGVHPAAPSTVAGPGPRRSLADVIAADPGRVLGAATNEAFGALPFLLKILAVDAPLSLQAHPNQAQARAGYDAEQGRGLALDAPERNYRDAHHKPEMVCALTGFEGFSGFRPVRDSARLLNALGGAVGYRYRDLLVAPGGLRDVVTGILTLRADVMADLVAEVAESAAALAAADGGEFAAEAGWLARLSAAYPGDRGVLMAALLNLVRLPPGGYNFVPAGQLHAHLSGVAVEIMADSDNVLRGGLTGKHVDVVELLRILDLREETVEVARVPSAAGAWFEYPSPVPEFRLARVDLPAPDVSRADPVEDPPAGPVEDAARSVSRAGGSPEILLCTAGAAEVLDRDGTATDLPRGGSVFVSADETVQVRRTGSDPCTVFAATTNLGVSREN